MFFPLCQLRRKMSRAKGNPFLQILLYSTPRPKFKAHSRWHLRINSFWRQLGSTLKLSRWHLGISSFWCQLGSRLGLKIPGDSLSGINLCFFWHLGINTFWRQLRSLLEFYPWHLGINSFWRQLGYPLGFGIPGDSFLEIPLCFLPLGFTMLIRSWRTTYFTVGVLV